MQIPRPPYVCLQKLWRADEAQELYLTINKLPGVLNVDAPQNHAHAVLI